LPRNQRSVNGGDCGINSDSRAMRSEPDLFGAHSPHRIDTTFFSLGFTMFIANRLLT
jgi:hypothetical protein